MNNFLCFGYHNHYNSQKQNAFGSKKLKTYLFSMKDAGEFGFGQFSVLEFFFCIIPLHFNSIFVPEKSSNFTPIGQFRPYHTNKSLIDRNYRKINSKPNQ